jgi:hypothetical protein
MNGHILSAAFIAAVAVASPAVTAQPPSTRDAAVGLVARIQRADYEGDRQALQRLHDELTALRSDDRRLAARLRYWEGFALWRRALNGFSQSAGPEDLQRDLEQAIVAFSEADARDPAFAEPRIAVLSCLGNLAYLRRGDAAAMKDVIGRMMPLTKEILAAAPESPRLYWVLGPQRWWTPVEQGGGQAAAFAAYEKGLQLARRQKSTTADPLEPSWGEPELLMNLAWSSLNQTMPDAAAAEAYAQQALRLVPNWRYLRDVLIPQIRKARER